MMHFKPIKIWESTKEEAIKQFIKRQKLDKLKNYLVKNNSQDVKYFIRIPYSEKLNIENIDQYS